VHLQGVISPFFFHEIRTITTGDLIEFIKPVAPMLVGELTCPRDDEVSLPPPVWATGCEQFPMTTEPKELVLTETKGQVGPKVEDTYFKNRLLTIHGIKDVLQQEREHIRLTKKWNSQVIAKHKVIVVTATKVVDANQRNEQDTPVFIMVQTVILEPVEVQSRETFNEAKPVMLVFSMEQTVMIPEPVVTQIEEASGKAK